ncbi:MAG: DUF3108 domain-containing protein [Pseudomonadota bacterium]|nr:DUF3108 domain-containing protein [Pseudomonadota bacterium]
MLRTYLRATSINLILSLTALAEIPQPFSVSYSLHTNGLKVGESVRALEKDKNGRYVFRSESRSSGILTLFLNDHVIEKSTWSLSGEDIHPLRYIYRQSGSKNSVQTVRFDWRAKTIDNREDNKTWRLRLTPNLFDKLVYQIAIMRDLAAGKRSFAYQIVDGGEIKDYRFAYLGEEVVDTPLGKIRAVRLERRKEKNNSKRSTTFWCAIRWRYLPVRVETISKNGRRITALIERGSGIPENPRRDESITR